MNLTELRFLSATKSSGFAEFSDGWYGDWQVYSRGVSVRRLNTPTGKPGNWLHGESKRSQLINAQRLAALAEMERE